MAKLTKGFNSIYKYLVKFLSHCISKADVCCSLTRIFVASRSRKLHPTENISSESDFVPNTRDK